MQVFCTDKSKTGTVLILVLWSLGMLTVFAVLIGVRVQDKIHVLSRLDKRERLRTTAASGIHKTMVIFFSGLPEEIPPHSAGEKHFRFNNPVLFRDKKIGRGSYDVSYWHYGQKGQPRRKRYGLTDEEQKINLNKAGPSALKILIQGAAGISEEIAEDLATAIIDWREYGETEIVGFYSDEYYENLEFPYKQKKADFERLEELLLVRGIDAAIYDRLKDFITVFGDGKININTASWLVFAALGLSDDLTQKIITVRRGPDGQEATADDMVFGDIGALAVTLSQFVELEESEVDQLGTVISQELLKTSSSYFSIQTTAKLDKASSSTDFGLQADGRSEDEEGAQERMVMTCVFHANDGKIIYWREK